MTKAKAKSWTFEAKTYAVGAEVKILNRLYLSDKIGNELN